MLVLSRRSDETLVIGNTIRVRVLEIRGGQVRLGIEAPAGVSVYREEVHEEIVRANRRASTRPDADLRGLARTLPRGRRA